MRRMLAVGKRRSAAASGSGGATSGIARAPALFAGRDHHAAPMRQALGRALAVELHLAALAIHRHERGDAEFGRLLQDPVHLLAARDALHAARCAAAIRCRSRACATISDFAAALVGGDDARVVVVAVAVEQHAGIADRQPQHAQQVRRRRFPAMRCACRRPAAGRHGPGSRACGGLVDGGAGGARPAAASCSSSMQ